MVALAPWQDGGGGLGDEAEDAVLAAERDLLGQMLHLPALAEAAIEIVAPRDFRGRGHEVIAHRIITMHASGTPVTVITLAAELEADGDLGSIGARIPVDGAATTVTGRSYLHSLYADAMPAAAASVAYLAGLVTNAAALRRIEESAIRAVQRARAPGADPAAIIAAAERDLAGAVTCPESGDDGMDIGEFCSAELAAAAPVIPGLLHAAERVIIVAGEGIGKSTLARQVWVMTAAGLHPFTGAAIPPKRTLYIDLENPPSIVQAKTRPLLGLGRAQPGWDDGRARIYSRPGGIDVRQPADAQRLAAVIKRAAPDLVIAGPLYKMTVDGGERAEQLHSAVAAFWDRMRERHGVALWLEAHAPMAQQGTRELRPLGSGVWQRWPEFGKTLRAASGNQNVLVIGQYRGDRDERQWPVRLTRPAWGEPWCWPWKAEYPKGTFGPEKAA